MAAWSPQTAGGASAKPAPPPTPAPQPEVVPEDHLDTADDQEVHRRAVRAILAAGGEAHVLLASGKIVNLNPTNAELPTEPFVLFTVSCTENRTGATGGCGRCGPFPR